MLIKNKDSKVNYATRLIALALASVIFIVVSCKVKSDNEASQDSTKAAILNNKMNPVVVTETDTVKGNAPVMYYQNKKIVSLDVVTPGGKPYADIKYDDGSSERITLKEAESRGFNIPPPPPPPPPPSKIKFTPPKVVKDEDVQFTPPKIIKDDKIFTKVEKEASFPGGDQSWAKYMRREIEKSIGEFTEKDFGTCVVKFVVKVDGTVSDAVATTMKGTTLAKVAVDAIMQGPKWIPAQQNGKNVNAYRLQPVTLINPEIKKG